MKNKIIKIVRKHNLEIDFVKYGTASRINNVIIFNEDLLSDPNYAMEILDHELRHSDGYKFKDLVMDLIEGSLFKYLKFMFKYPKAFLQIVPFGSYKGQLFIDVNQIITYLLMMTAGGIIFWIVT